MRWTYTLGRVGETEIKLHLTFFLLLAYWAAGGYEAGGMSGAIGAVAMLIALFVCVLLHEFGHITMARRFGVRTPDVLILPIGGVARLERIPDEPKQELLIALAGPAVTLAIAAVLYLVLRLSGGTADIDNLSPATPFVEALFRTNVLLLLFNLIPAFPMDGGRVLRALLAMRMNYRRATEIASAVGQGLALLFGLAGFAIGNFFLILIAVFVWFGASQEGRAVEIRTVLGKAKVRDAMIRSPRTLAPNDPLTRAAELTLNTSQADFPVIDTAERVVGLLTADDLIRALHQQPGQAIGTAMRRDFPVATPEEPLVDVQARFGQTALRAMPVVEPDGHLAGLLTAADVSEAYRLLAVQPALVRDDGRWRTATATADAVSLYGVQDRPRPAPKEEPR
jgi:stage IV sporulation protein FB